MDPNETMVEEMDTEVVGDDALQEDLVEESDDSQSIESALDEEETNAQPAEEEPQEKGASEPGWIKKRVDKAVQKAVAETEARMQAMFDAQMAPIREKLLEDEANKLVKNGTVKDLETAKELVRYRQGQNPVPTQQQGESHPRNEKGQFTPRQDEQQRDPVVQKQINMLQHQADRIKAAGGPDVISEFQNNEEIHEKVIKGEMDFYDVAEYMKAPPKKKPPAPMRSPNGASGSEKSTIASMSDEQFERFEKKVSSGVRYSVK